MTNAQEIVKNAKRYLGIKEGSKEHHAIIDRYNNYKKKSRSYKVKYTDAWCMTFISSIFIEAGEEYAALIPIECSCFYAVNLATSRGIWVEDDNFRPKVGDLIIYDWQDLDKGDCKGVPDHVGLVCEVDGNKLLIIEGNKNDAVEYRAVTVGQKCIRGYICPRYNSVDITNVAKQVIAGLWGNGVTRRIRLEAAGYNYKEVQEEVNRLLK